MFIGRWGAERILAEDVAGLLGTINYEIACDVSPRVVRRYVEQPASEPRPDPRRRTPVTPPAPRGDRRRHA